MKKLVAFLAIACLILLALLVTSLRIHFSYRNTMEHGYSRLKKQVSGEETDEQKLNRQAFKELLLQYSGTNLLYSENLKRPIRAVSEENWNLIEYAFLFNFTNEKIQKNTIQLSTSFTEDNTIVAFYYMPTDSSFSLQESPPKDGWIQLEKSATGNYILPLIDVEESNGCKFIAFKYLLDNDMIFYGLIAFK